ncbi:nucleolar complex protein 2 homolog isoform X2 [Bombus vosnesenskii]|uniref:Nucleolar complex protein 2 homolog isoform X2 n=1 Tax=Bombus vosnesenskii TaxID=207650 RepID=A0A6J3KNS6_9HYME|nr:nucleolar complex protein 2 homolog isoform X2 [Bombus vosnesenskii]XP_033353807.1 nucleolar complex protein 2 homolog isoform X2 [Bombus vosnesenskii]XP_033353808.1 nucleolar complex protein 2 homolog isoform X2 [Bombus vosnesenskii]XP_033353809.1 nucleolar complex protein 2 homolog isoform X2 [Bombus vosnesenskii]
MMKIKKEKSVKGKTKKLVTKKRKQLKDATMDDFFNQTFEDEINGNDNNEQGENTYEDDAGSSESDMDPVEHKKSLMRLKDTDPEFYKYLKENDKNLLEFNISDEDDDINNDDKSSLNELDTKHIPSSRLEVASDESDYEMDQGSEIRDKRKITLKLLKTWQEDIQKDKSSKTIKCAVEAFHAALHTVAESADPQLLQYKVEGGAVFNEVVQLCILYLPGAFKRYLKLSSETQPHIHKLKRFGKVKNILKSYLTDLIKILQNVTSSNILTILLKHLHQMLPYTQSFSSLTKPLLKILLKFWSTGEESVRVVSFLSILRIATSNQESVLEILFKTMYVKYVENSKFVSLTTLPAINFMRHSLVEIYLLDSNLAYNHAFLYIRQLAIHLRNAMTLKKKEHFQAVYNWQYINSLRFWSELINLSKSDSMLHSLLYPLVQIIIGTIKVIPTPQYYPLRFHCLQMLIDISRETGTFIPVLPFLLEILNSYDFNKKHKAVSMKPIPFICILRMSKSQLQENGFKDNVIDSIYKLILENAAKDSHTVYFPDLYIPCIIQLKAFLKKCHIANYCRKMKQLLDKIAENRKYIETERNKTAIDLKNMQEITNWENKIKVQGTSLSKFYESWIKIHQSQKLKLLTKNEDIAEYSLPTIRKLKKGIEDKEESSDESEFDMRIKSDERKSDEDEKHSRPKRKKLKVSKAIKDIDLPKENTDIVQDINSDDWD